MIHKTGTSLIFFNKKLFQVSLLNQWLLFIETALKKKYIQNMYSRKILFRLQPEKKCTCSSRIDHFIRHNKHEQQYKSYRTTIFLELIKPRESTWCVLDYPSLVSNNFEKQLLQNGATHRSTRRYFSIYIFDVSLIISSNQTSNHNLCISRDAWPIAG